MYQFCRSWLCAACGVTKRKRSVRAGLTPRRQASTHTSFSLDGEVWRWKW